MYEHTTMRLPRITPAPPHAYSRSFPGTPAQVHQARTFLTETIKGFPEADDAVLLLSELCANACAHTASGQPGGTFVVRICAWPGAHLHAEVEDQGSAWDGDLSAAQPPHGLFLLRALSTECGTRRGEHGWITWFTIASPKHEARS